jgi:hypothetical protein
MNDVVKQGETAEKPVTKKHTVCFWWRKTPKHNFTEIGFPADFYSFDLNDKAFSFL